jgi:uncharacterized protein (DUF2141 family)
MKERPMLRRHVVTSLLLLCVCLGSSPGARAEGPAKASVASGQVLVKVSGFRSERGKVLVALWRGPKDFPGKPPAGSLTASVQIVKGVAEASFSDVPPGVFAVTVFHDEDGNGELKKSFIGIPKEGIGFSRDARARFGPPDWDACKLTLAPAEVKSLKITMLYY